MTEHLEILRSVTVLCIGVVKGRQQADTLHLRLRYPTDRLGGFNPDCFEQRRDHVNRVRVLMTHFAASRNSSGPRDDARVRNATPVGLSFPAAKRRVPGPGPSPSVVIEGVLAPPLLNHFQIVLKSLRGQIKEHALVASAVLSALSAGAVVRHCNNERVLGLAGCFDGVKDASDMEVRLRNETCVHLHLPGVHAFCILGEGIPRFHVWVAFGEFRARSQEPEFALTLKDDLAILIPARIECTLVGLNPLRFDLMRSVTGACSKPQKEGFVGCARMGIGNV